METGTAFGFGHGAGTILFALAVLHTFSIKFFQHEALKHREGSILENLFHLLGEVEIVFGLWAGVLVVFAAVQAGGAEAIKIVEKADFTEPAFVFAIMTVASTRPVLEFAMWLIGALARLLPFRGESGFYVTALTIGPLLGSFISEPAAMTVTALILRDRFFSRKMSDRFMYVTLGVLFVNVSIGGVLTHFAAPPVVMVSGIWGWDTNYMMNHFGWKTAVATAVNALAATVIFSKEMRMLPPPNAQVRKYRTPWWLRALHLVFLALIVATGHHMSVFMGLLLFFIGVTAITKEYQEELNLRQALLVGFFLGGLVVLGGFQRWWLEPLLRNLDALPLFLGAAGLTAVTDNAALTYLGAQIPGVGDAFKYALVAGAVAGGGLTVIANAPNPAGFAILRERFGPEGISPGKLFLGAFVPTLVALACLWFLPSL